MRLYRWILALGLAALLTGGCVRVYKVDVQQGNEIAEEQVRQLEPGMSRTDVRALLGTPLVEDPFRNNRWDYVYTFRPGRSKEVERRRLTVFFDDDSLVRLEGGADPESIPVVLLDVSEMAEEQREEDRERAKLEREARQGDTGFWESVDAFFDNLTGSSDEQQ